MMKVTYTGRKDSVDFDGVSFPRNEAVEYNGKRGKKLIANRFFDVDEDRDGGEGKPPFPTGSKDKLEAWARENLQLELDKRKSMKDLIAQVTEALEARDGGE